MDIVKLITEQMTNSEPVLGKAEMKAVALATISQNFAVAARRGRTVFASNIVKDVGAFNSAGVLGVDRWRQTANDGRYEYENKKIELVNHNRPP